MRRRASTLQEEHCSAVQRSACLSIYDVTTGTSTYSRNGGTPAKIALLHLSQVSSVLLFVKPRVLKDELNAKFREKHPYLPQSLTLSKIRSVKRQALFGCHRAVECRISRQSSQKLLIEAACLRVLRFESCALSGCRYLGRSMCCYRCRSSVECHVRQVCLRRHGRQQTGRPCRHMSCAYCLPIRGIAFQLDSLIIMVAGNGSCNGGARVRLLRAFVPCPRGHEA